MPGWQTRSNLKLHLTRNAIFLGDSDLPASISPLPALVALASVPRAEGHCRPHSGPLFSRASISRKGQARGKEAETPGSSSGCQSPAFGSPLVFLGAALPSPGHCPLWAPVSWPAKNWRWEQALGLEAGQSLHLHWSVCGQVPTVLPVQLPAHARWEAAADDSSPQVPAAHMGDPDGESCFLALS